MSCSTVISLPETKMTASFCRERGDIGKSFFGVAPESDTSMQRIERLTHCKVCMTCVHAPQVLHHPTRLRVGDDQGAGGRSGPRRRDARRAAFRPGAARKRRRAAP